MKKYAINYYTNDGRYDGVEVEVETDSLVEVCNAVLNLGYNKKISSIAEVVEVD